MSVSQWGPPVTPRLDWSISLNWDVWSHIAALQLPPSQKWRWELRPKYLPLDSVEPAGKWDADFNILTALKATWWQCRTRVITSKHGRTFLYKVQNVHCSFLLTQRDEAILNYTLFPLIIPIRILISLLIESAKWRKIDAFFTFSTNSSILNFCNKRDYSD